MANIKHAVERRAFKTMIDSLIKKGQGGNLGDALDSYLNMAQKVLGDSWKASSYAMLHELIKKKDGKWANFVHRIFRDVDPGILESFLLNAVYEAGFRGFKTAGALSEKYDINVPWIVLMDPTSACNMHCTGCWAAEYGYKQNLSFEDMDRVLTEGKVLGTHACLFTGGEPLIRKDDIIKLCEKHQDIAFHAFTNSTLIDDQFCKDLLRVKNFFLSLSIEGFEETNDARRGKGHFRKVMKAMDLMKSYRIPFGVSICYTAQNYKVVTSDEFIDMLIDKGCFFAWYFHYMPVGMSSGPELLLSPEQREYVKDRIRWIRGLDVGKELFAIDFQNDGEFVNGCIAAGKKYCHINAAGDVEPCVFIHYSGANIHDKSFRECLEQPLFRAYRRGQPFNENLLRPCPMLENPEILQKLVHETGAHSTDLEEQEPVEHLCGKCIEYAANWQPVADRIWQESHPTQGAEE